MTHNERLYAIHTMAECSYDLFAWLMEQAYHHFQSSLMHGTERDWSMFHTPEMLRLLDVACHIMVLDASTYEPIGYLFDAAHPEYATILLRYDASTNQFASMGQVVSTRSKDTSTTTYISRLFSSTSPLIQYLRQRWTGKM